MLCMWRGVGRQSIMVPAKDVGWLETLFYAQPAYVHLAPALPPTEDAAAAAGSGAPASVTSAQAAQLDAPASAAADCPMLPVGTEKAS